MLIKEWLSGFIARHRDAWPDGGWPDESGPGARRLWGMFMDEFKPHRVTEDEAYAASEHVGADAPCWEHPALIRSLVITAREGAAAKAAADEAAAAERGTAAAASAGCPRCAGSGMVEVFDPAYDGRRVMTRECVLPGGMTGRAPFAMVVAAHCECPMGRWTRRRTDPALLPRVPDLVEVLAGKTRWMADDPTGDVMGPWFQRLDARGGPVHAPGGVPEGS